MTRQENNLANMLVLFTFGVGAVISGVVAIWSPTAAISGGAVCALAALYARHCIINEDR